MASSHRASQLAGRSVASCLGRASQPSRADWQPTDRSGAARMGCRKPCGRPGPRDRFSWPVAGRGTFALATSESRQSSRPGAGRTIAFAPATLGRCRRGGVRNATNSMTPVGGRWRVLSFSEALRAGLSFGDARSMMAGDPGREQCRSVRSRSCRPLSCSIGSPSAQRDVAVAPGHAPAGSPGPAATTLVPPRPLCAAHDRSRPFGSNATPGIVPGYGGNGLPKALVGTEVPEA